MNVSIGVVSDEVADSLPSLLRFVTENSVSHVEVNYIAGLWAGTMTPEMAWKVTTSLADVGASIAMTGTRCFRSPVTDDRAYFDDMEALRRSAAIAHILGAPTVRVFSFARQRPLAWEIRDLMTERLRQAVEVASREGVRIVIENTGSGNVASTAEISALFDVPGLSGAGLLWDPANAIGAGDHVDAAAALDELRPLLSQMHVKNVLLGNGGRTWAAVEQGLIDYAKLLPAAIRYGVSCFTLDTHWRLPGDETGELSTRHNLNIIRRLVSSP